MAGELSRDEIIRYLEGVAGGGGGSDGNAPPDGGDDDDRIRSLEREIKELREELKSIRELIVERTWSERRELADAVAPGRTGDEGARAGDRERREDVGRRMVREVDSELEERGREQKEELRGPEEYKDSREQKAVGAVSDYQRDEAGAKAALRNLEDEINETRSSLESAKQRGEERDRVIERQTGEVRQKAEVAHHEAREARREVREIKIARHARPEDIQRAFNQHQQAVQRQIDGFRGSLERAEDSIRRIPEIVRAETQKISEVLNRNMRTAFEVQYRQMWNVLENVQNQIGKLEAAIGNVDARVVHIINRYNADVPQLKNTLNNVMAEIKFVEDRVRRVEDEARRGFR